MQSVIKGLFSYVRVYVFNLFQDGAVVTSSKPLGDALTVSEVEADPGDGLGRIDYSSGDVSRHSSDNADVSVLHVYLLYSSLQPFSRFDLKLHELDVFLLLLTFYHHHL